MTEEETHTSDVKSIQENNEIAEESQNRVVDAETKGGKSPVSSSLNETHENNTSDEHIDNILKEVEGIRLNKQSSTPIKGIVEDSALSTPDSTILSTQHPQDEASITMDSPPKGLEKPILQETAAPEKTKIKANIPNSVSQALFSQPLKVTKIREKSPTPKFVGIKGPADPAATKRFDELQSRDQELTLKIHKLNKEIEYLKSLVETASVTSDLSELRKLKYAIEKLEEYLDKKQKDKYEVGIQLTRAVRKRVDSGESGEFWVS